MAKYGSNSIVVTFDLSDGTTATNMTQYITSINNIDVESLMEETHSFGDTWFESLATGMKKMSDVVLGGIYDDTATTGPDAVFNAPSSGPSATSRTLTITWGGSKTTSCECWIAKYSRKATRGELTKFEVTLRPTGTVTEV